MTDLTLLPPDYRVQLIKLGKRFSSDDVFAQAAQTGKEYAHSGGILAEYGYDDSDATDLDELVAALKRELSVRDTKRTRRRLTRSEIDAIEKDARQTRRFARNTLESARDRLRAKGQEEPARKIDAVLAETEHANPDDDLLRRHLSLLHSTLNDGDILRACGKAAEKLRVRLPVAVEAMNRAEASRPRRTSTPGSNDRIDLLDGLIIKNVRAARRAAANAAEELGKPHILKAFLLLELYGKRRTDSTESQEFEELDDLEDDDLEDDEPNTETG